MLQRDKKVPKDGVQSARNLVTWKIGLQKDIQLETRCQITKTKKKKPMLYISRICRCHLDDVIYAVMYFI